MRIAIICIDSADNALQYLALAKGLQSAGHFVRILAPDSLTLVASKTAPDLDFIGVEGDLHVSLQPPSVSGMREDAHYSAHFLRVRFLSNALTHWTEVCLNACVDADLILGGANGMLVGEGVAEKLGIRFIQTHLHPFTPNRCWPPILFPRFVAAAPGIIRSIAHEITRQMYWQPIRHLVNTTRNATLGLAPISFRGSLGRLKNDADQIIYGFSPTLLPRPGNWKSNMHVTGFWFHKERCIEPPKALLDFIEHKAKPVCIDLEAMHGSDSESMMRMVIESLRHAKMHGVIIAKTSQLPMKELPRDVYVTDRSAYNWLLPKAAFLVHAGSAYSLGTTLAAGKPSLALPIGGEQPFWAWLLETHGLGPHCIPRQKLTAEGMSNKCFKKNAQRIGMEIRNEDGIGNVVKIINSLR